MVIPFKRLEDLAFEVAYQEIISNLLLCPDHVSHKANTIESFCHRVSRSSFLSLNLPKVTSKSIREFVRDRLNLFLVGTMSDTIRQRLIEKFFQEIGIIHDRYGDYEFSERPDAWVFLDCVLDETFKALHISSLPSNNFGEGHKLFKTIASRAPSITSLEINFHYTGEMSLEMQTAFIDCLKSVEHLTDLKLEG